MVLKIFVEFCNQTEWSIVRSILYRKAGGSRMFYLKVALYLYVFLCLLDSELNMVMTTLTITSASVFFFVSDSNVILTALKFILNLTSILHFLFMLFCSYICNFVNSWSCLG